MQSWEYCVYRRITGRRGGDFYHVGYISENLQDQVRDGLLQDEFQSWAEGITRLGDGGWEAFHIDSEGAWYFKRPEDDDTDWGEDVFENED